MIKRKYFKKVEELSLINSEENSDSDITAYSCHDTPTRASKCMTLNFMGSSFGDDSSEVTTPNMSRHNSGQSNESPRNQNSGCRRSRKYSGGFNVLSRFASEKDKRVGDQNQHGSIKIVETEEEDNVSPQRKLNLKQLPSEINNLQLEKNFAAISLIVRKSRRQSVDRSDSTISPKTPVSPSSPFHLRINPVFSFSDKMKGNWIFERLFY